MGYDTKSAMMGLNRVDCLDGVPNKPQGGIVYSAHTLSGVYGTTHSY